MAINYIQGDATLPQGQNPKLIVHIVNNIGRFGSGFAKAVMNRYPIVRESYLSAFSSGTGLKLGDVQFVEVADNLWFANMVAQNGLISKSNPTPIKYDALISCLKQVLDFVHSANIKSLHMPKIGSNRAGGNWRIVEQIIIAELCDNDISPIVYEFDET